MFDKGTCINTREKLINTVWACFGTRDTHIAFSVSPSPFPGPFANPQLLGPVRFLQGLLLSPMPPTVKERVPHRDTPSKRPDFLP